jgi:competence protein ComEC
LLRYLQKFTGIFDAFPALSYGLSFTIGVAAAWLVMPYLLILILTCLLFSSRLKQCLTLYLGLLAWAATVYIYPSPKLPEEGAWGYAEIAIERLSLKTSRKGQQYLYKGVIRNFWVEDQHLFQNAPFYLTIPVTALHRPEATCNYLIYCKAAPTNSRTVRLQKAEHSEWIPVPNTHSLSEWRYHAKTWANEKLKMLFHSPPVQSFLSGIVTGEFDDKELFTSFKQFGLLHLLAISGFHFNIGLFLPDKLKSYALIVLLSLYFLFLGWGPSVLRAWMTILLFYSAAFAGRFSHPANSLGIALLLSLMLDPSLFSNIGFQFSFITTAAILFLHPPLNKQLDRWFPKHSYSDAVHFPTSSKHAYVFLRFCQNNLSITLATSLAALPLSLLLFGEFPLLSVVYNLFFPFLTSVSVTLLITGIVLTPLYPVSQAIHLMNDYFTSFILNLTYFD